METGTESSVLGKWESAWGLDVALGAEGRWGAALMIFMKPGSVLLQAHPRKVRVCAQV